ncbi:MAG: threonine ammonia-lyase [Gemmatimonadota bacterium]
MPVTPPYTIDDVLAARHRIAPFLQPTPLRTYGVLDDAVGYGISVVVKHENFNPTNSFKVRNGLSFVTALDPQSRARGIIAATRGNHGLGIAWAGREFGVRSTICVPFGNNPDKNAAMRALGATVHEAGHDYDESLAVALRLQKEIGGIIAHSTNDRSVMAGAATMSLELMEQAGEIDAMVVAIGGGSQAVGAISIARVMNPRVQVFGVQAARAAATWESWRAREIKTLTRADTFADGLATRTAYEMAFPTLLDGLADFVTVTESELAHAMRTLIFSTHTLVEGAGAAGLAGLIQLAPRLSGKRVAIVISGGNVDHSTLNWVLANS